MFFLILFQLEQPTTVCNSVLSRREETTIFEHTQVYFLQYIIWRLEPYFGIPWW